MKLASLPAHRLPPNYLKIESTRDHANMNSLKSKYDFASEGPHLPSPLARFMLVLYYAFGVGFVGLLSQKLNI